MRNSGLVHVSMSYADFRSAIEMAFDAGKSSSESTIPEIQLSDHLRHDEASGSAKRYASWFCRRIIMLDLTTNIRDIFRSDLAKHWLTPMDVKSANAEEVET